MENEFLELISDFEKQINYTFKNKDLIFEALSHSSFSNLKRKTRHSNERLEFLGDSVLSIVVSDYIYKNHTNFPEGELTKLRSSLVCEKSLFEFAKKIHLGDYILMGKGERRARGNERPSIVSDAFEAVIAAIYLDSGMEVVRDYILGFIPKKIDQNKPINHGDYKTILQEIIQKNPEELVEYNLKDEFGPDHDKTFVIQVLLNSNVIGEGKGTTKKHAEQMAAKEALELMGYEA